MRTPWLLLWRDAQAARGRLLTAGLALAVGMAGVVAMVGSAVVLAREVPRNYRSTQPADALLELEQAVPESVVARVRRLTDVTHAAPTALLRGRVPRDGQAPLTALVFVVSTFAEERLNVARLVRGGWAAGDGVMIERASLALAGLPIGTPITLALPDGTVTLPLRGVVHEPGLAPASQEQAAYAFVEASTLARVGYPVVFDRLKLAIGDSTADPATIERVARTVADSLGAWGIVVHEVRLPPRGQHPHQTQLDAVLRMLVAFSGLALLLAAVLMATLIHGLLAQQRGEIAVLKALGATTAQVARLYLALVGGVALVALATGVVLGALASAALLRAVAVLLNLELASLAWPAWVWVVVWGLGLGVPLLLTLGPIVAASRRPIREALDARGVIARPDAVTTWLTTRWRRWPTVTLALRNLFRRRLRTLLTLGLLGGAGAMVLTSGALRAGWTALVRDAARLRRDDFELRLAAPMDPAAIRAALSHVSDVRVIEPWTRAALAVADTGRVRVTASYPDGGHGTITLLGAPAATRLLQHEVVAGRWLVPGDSDAVVLNDLAAQGAFRGRALGERVRVLVGDTVATVRIVGLVREPLTGGAAYVEAGALATSGWTGAGVDRYRVATRPGADVAAVAQAIGKALAPVRVAGLTVTHHGAGAQRGHVAVLIAAIDGIALVMLVVGLMGLASSLGVSVAERTREFGILRSVGATPAQVRRLVIGEGVALAAVSGGWAVLVALALSAVVGRVLAAISAQPIEPRLGVGLGASWFVAVQVAAAVVCVVPAQRAVRRSVRDAVATV